MRSNQIRKPFSKLDNNDRLTTLEVEGLRSTHTHQYINSNRIPPLYCPLVSDGRQVHLEFLVLGHEALVDELLGALHADLCGQRVEGGGPGVIGDGIEGGACLRNQLLQDLILLETVTNKRTSASIVW